LVQSKTEYGRQGMSSLEKKEFDVYEIESGSNAGWRILEGFSAVTQAVRSTARHMQGKRPQNEIVSFDRGKAHLNKSLHESWRNVELENELKYGKEESVEECMNSFCDLGLNISQEMLGSSSFHDMFEASQFGTMSSHQLKAVNSLEIFPRQKPLSLDEWMSFFDSEGRVTEPKALLKRICFGGVSEEIRRPVWLYLFGLYPFDMTDQERDLHVQNKIEEYWVYKNQWVSITKEQEENFTKFVNRRHRIEKDVVRTDRQLEEFKDEDSVYLDRLRSILLTYSFYNFDLGYVQGMNDLLVPILLTIENEAEAFWCFKHLMDKKSANFHQNQEGMHTQLQKLSELVKILVPDLYRYLQTKEALNMFFCFRWILIVFKREFNRNEIYPIWEAFWAFDQDPDLHLFFAVAILLQHKSVIIENDMDFDNILKYTNNLTRTLDYKVLLENSEVLYRQWKLINQMSVEGL